MALFWLFYSHSSVFLVHELFRAWAKECRRTSEHVWFHQRPQAGFISWMYALRLLCVCVCACAIAEDRRELKEVLTLEITEDLGERWESQEQPFSEYSNLVLILLQITSTLIPNTAADPLVVWRCVCCTACWRYSMFHMIVNSQNSDRVHGHNS